MTIARLRTYLAAAVAALLAVASLCGCNAQKKNTAAARQYTAFITRYNIYYNGDTHYQETLQEMERKYDDDYTRLLFPHPAEAKADPKAPQPQGDFTRSIEKAQKAIQIRSIKKKPRRKGGKQSAEYKAWLKRDEYNPFIHNAWMMMGRSQYLNGDFLGAASTFFYVSKHFTWLPATVTEAQLWQARSYAALDWIYESELILNRIKPEQLTNGTLRHLYDFTHADVLIRSRDYAGAIPYLSAAIKGANSRQKPRLNFLLGQLYELTGEKEQAYQAFKRAGSSSSISYRAKLNARIKQSEVFSGSDIAPEVKALRRMTRYDRNKDYLDQIYYAIGNLYLSRGDTAQAISNYETAVSKSTRSGIEKAIAQITLGELYFSQGNYAKAQPCYAEAVPLLPDTYPHIATLKRRSDVLDELAVYSQNVNLQDSLLALAAMTDDERARVIDRLIEEYKKRQKEEAEAATREEYEAEKQANESKIQDTNQRQFSINNDDSWYFYNQTTRNQGKTEFQKRWGSRKLEDNWRRRNKMSFNTDDFEPDTEAADSTATDGSAAQPSAEEKERLASENDPTNPQYYLKDIPMTPEAQAQAHEIIQEGLYNMGVILKDKLDDPRAADAQFQRLLRDYPDNVYRLDTYYNLYLMNARAGDAAAAEHYRQLIITDFPESSYGIALRDPQYIDKLRRMDSEQERIYEQAYADYLANRNEAVHAARDTMERTFPMSKIMPKFMFIDALAYVTENNQEKFNATLRDMLERYPETDLTPIASAWLKGMAQGRKLHAPENGNLRGMLWDIRLGNDSTATAADSTAQFQISDDSPQLLVFIYPTDSVNGNELLYNVARHNFQSFVVKDFDLEPMNFGRLGMLVVKGFDNLKELNHYRRVMAASPTFRLPRGVMPVAISAENFQLLLDNGRSFDDYFRFLQEHNYQDAQASILQPEERETLEEAEEAATLPSPPPGMEGLEPAAEDAGPETESAETATEESKTDVTNAAPAEKPAATPEQKVPAAKPEQKATPAKPAQKKAEQKKPAAKLEQKKPANKPAQPKPAQPKAPLPAYDPGSEGDDPLLN